VSLSATSIACRPESCDPISFAVAPTDSVRPTLAIEPKSRRLITTSLSATYLPNSLRLRVLTIEAKDHRLEAINTVGAIASGAVALGEKGLSNPDPIEAAKKQRAVSPSLADLKLPVTIALADAKCQGPQEAGCVPAILADPASPPTNARPRALPRNPGWTYSLAFIDNPRADGFLPQAAIGRVHGAVIASICRRAQLRLEHAGVAPVEGEVVVADPDWLEEAPFPTKGALTFHPLCGVDVQPESVTEITTDQLATAFFNQVSAVHAAQKSRK
jgi:hypothetical protein